MGSNVLICIVFCFGFAMCWLWCICFVGFVCFLCSVCVVCVVFMVCRTQAQQTANNNKQTIIVIRIAIIIILPLSNHNKHVFPCYCSAFRSISLRFGGKVGSVSTPNPSKNQSTCRSKKSSKTCRK